MPSSPPERIISCFKALAIGDAIGKQTETLSREDVRRWYPAGVRGFEGPPGSVIPHYAGSRRWEWRVGETTDDTERTIAVAKAILRDGEVSHVTVGELLQCRKSVHPGVKSYWEFHQAGDPVRIAQGHDGCGAAIRVAPVGVLYTPENLDRLVVAARESSIPTHGGPLAIAAAAATAAAVSAAIDGGSPEEVASLAQRAGGLTLSQAIQEVRRDLCEWSELDPDKVAGKYFPNTPLTIVPLALALATVVPSAQDVILLATNIGADSDSVASIAGAIAGAMFPETVNDDWYTVVEEINQHHLHLLAERLISARRAANASDNCATVQEEAMNG